MSLSKLSQANLFDSAAFMYLYKGKNISPRLQEEVKGLIGVAFFPTDTEQICEKRKLSPYLIAFREQNLKRCTFGF
jgi:hypothetical protein